MPRPLERRRGGFRSAGGRPQRRSTVRATSPAVETGRLPVPVHGVNDDSGRRCGQAGCPHVAIPPVGPQPSGRSCTRRRHARHMRMCMPLNSRRGGCRLSPCRRMGFGNFLAATCAPGTAARRAGQAGAIEPWCPSFSVSHAFFLRTWEGWNRQWPVKFPARPHRARRLSALEPRRVVPARSRDTRDRAAPTRKAPVGTSRQDAFGRVVASRHEATLDDTEVIARLRALGREFASHRQHVLAGAGNSASEALAADISVDGWHLSSDHRPLV